MSLSTWYYGFTEDEYIRAKQNLDFLNDKLSKINKYYYEYVNTDKEQEYEKIMRLEMCIKCIKYYYNI